MELSQLEAFLTLARTGSFSRTAETLHLVQSTVSVRIRVLEEDVGKPLFVRSNRRVELTPAGQTLLPYAERMLDLAKSGRQKLQAIGRFEDKITVGAADSLWRHVLQPIVLDVFHNHPEIAFELRTGHAYQTLEQLRNGTLQLCFAFLKPNFPGMQVVPFYRDTIILAASPRHPLAARRLITKDDFEEAPFIAMDWDFQGLWGWVRRMLPFDFFPRVQLDMLSMLVAFIAAGNGIGFVPRRMVQQELDDKRLVELKMAPDIKPPTRQAYAVFRREKQPRPAVQLWLDSLKRHGFKLGKT